MQTDIHLCPYYTSLPQRLPHEMRQGVIQTVNHTDAATTYILSPNILPVEELRNMLRHIKSQLPSTMHLPISSDDTLHFYQYLKTHILTADSELDSSMYLYMSI